jgi:AmpE protein
MLLAIDRLNMIQLSEEYLTRLRRADWEGAALMLDSTAGERLQARRGPRAESAEQVHIQFRDLLLGSYLERLFTVVFWYLVLGPLGVLVYLILRLYRNDQGLSASPAWAARDELGNLHVQLVYLMEWLPARLLALSFALAGDFEGAFAELRQRFFSEASATLLVTEAAVAAVRVPAARALLLDDGIEESALPLSPVISETRALLALMVRSQVIWLAVIALLTVYGYAI